MRSVLRSASARPLLAAVDASVDPCAGEGDDDACTLADGAKGAAEHAEALALALGPAWHPARRLALLWQGCPPAVVEEAAKSTIELERALAARHPLVPDALRRELERDPAPLVRALASRGVLAVESSAASREVRLLDLIEAYAAQCTTRDVVCMARLLGTLARAGALVTGDDFPLGEHAAAAVDAATTEPVLDVLAVHPSTLVAVLVALRTDLPWSVERTALSRRERAGPSHVQIVRARLTSSASTLASLAGSFDARVRKEVALNPACPPKVLHDLATDRDREVVYAAAASPALGPEHFRHFAPRLDDLLAETLNPDPRLPPELLAAITRGRLSGWYTTAAHPDLPAEAVVHLSEDANDEARALAARHPNAPDDVLARLGEDSSPVVAAAVLQHPRCPEALLARAAANPALEVRAEVADRLVPADWDVLAESTSSGSDAAVVAACSRHTPDALLARLAVHPSPHVRTAALMNPRTPFAVVADAARTNTGEAALRRPDCPPDVVAALAARGYTAALAHPACPPDVLDAALAAPDASAYRRSELASNPNLPLPALLTLVADPDDTVARHAAWNPSLPERVLVELGADFGATVEAESRISRARAALRFRHLRKAPTRAGEIG